MPLPQTCTGSPTPPGRSTTRPSPFAARPTGSPPRLLLQTGECLDELDEQDLRELEAAFRLRAETRGGSWGNDRTMLHGTRTVLYHLGILDHPPSRSRVGRTYAHRFDGVPPALRASFSAYTERLGATHAPSTIGGIVTCLAQFGRFLGATDPELSSLAALDRRRHIEPWLAALAERKSQRDGVPLSVGDRRNRVLTLGRFFADIAEWEWPEAPSRRLVFSRDVPRRPQALPRYLTLDVDRRLAEALQRSENRLFADGLLLARATGLRIGELCDLELDCAHEAPGVGTWLKVPLGKLDTERMVPLDEESLALVDRIVEHRTPDGPSSPAHRTARRLPPRPPGPSGLRPRSSRRARRAAQAAGVEHVTPHQFGTPSPPPS